MNNDETEILPTTLREEAFDVVMRGYHRRQVDDYVTRTKQQIDELRSRASLAEQEVYDARHDADQAREETDTLKGQLEHYDPSPDELGERVSQILRLAKQESEDRRNAALEDAQRLRAEAKEETDRLRTDAKEEADSLVRQASEEAERLRSGSAEEAERVRTEARQEAEQLREEVRESTERLRTDAEDRAQRMLAEAEDRAHQIEDGSKERVQRLDEHHTELMGRLSAAHSALRKLLEDQGEEAHDRGEEAQPQDDASTSGTGEPGDTVPGDGAPTAVQEAVVDDAAQETTELPAARSRR